MQMRNWMIAAGLALAFAAPARAQAPTCQETPSVVVTAGTAVPAPRGHTMLELVSATGATIPGFQPSVSGGQWTPSAGDVQALTGALTANAGTALFLQWSGGPGGAEACTQSFRVVEDDDDDDDRPIVPPPTLPGPGEGGTAEGTAWNEGQCSAAGRQWESELRASVGSSHFTEIVFLEDGGVCYRSRDYGVTGDPIYVGVFTDNPTAWNGANIEFDPCAIESASPAILVSDQPSVLSGFQSLTPAWRLRTYPERTCYNTSVVITVQGVVNGTTVTARTTLEQAQRYRATLHLGTAFTRLHDRSFGLRPDGSDQKIFGRGPTDIGPEYYAAVVLYGLPRYIPSLFGGERYRGRDPVHDNGFFDRIGGVLGVGISDPRKQFVAGFSFEALTGVNVTGTWFVSRITKLGGGLQEGQVFAGSASDIPTRQEWDNAFVLGLSMDLRYAASLISR